MKSEMTTTKNIWPSIKGTLHKLLIEYPHDQLIKRHKQQSEMNFFHTAASVMLLISCSIGYNNTSHSPLAIQ